MGKIVRLRRPSLVTGSPLIFVQNVANRITKGGEECADSILRVRITDELRKDPDRIRLEGVARGLVEYWHRSNNEAINGPDGVRFIPGAYVKVKDAVSVQMRRMGEAHLRSWLALNQKVRDDFERTMARKDAQIQRWLRDFAAHPSLILLGEIEQQLHGYVPSPEDDMPYRDDEDKHDEPAP